ncbi:CHASE domain-containing protein [Parvibaculum sp.]|uniref:CHASE domain-containing protein n=1 Tax=Parvibaculum sp. TaxID=2024848 RepID=UPI003210E8F0
MDDPGSSQKVNSNTSPDLKRAASSLPAWLVLVVGVLLTMLVTVNQKRDVEDDAVRQFAFSADQVTLKIRERLDSYELILRGSTGLLTASGGVTRRDWKTYVEETEAEKIVPGFQGIGFSKVIQPQELAQHIASVRAEGFPNYTVRPAGNRPIYTSIIYLEPFRDRNLRAFGYDMYSEPVRRAAMDRARDLDKAALSGPVRLVQETESDIQTGTLMYVPVYRHGVPINTVEERRAALIGWTYSPYRMRDLISGILLGWEGAELRHIDLRIYDGRSAEPEKLLYERADADLSAHRSAFYQQRIMDFHGQSWLLSFDRLPNAPPLSYARAWASLVGGLAFSGLLFALMRSLLGTREHAERIAEALTADIRRHEQLLQESEFRWKFAIEGAGDGLWDWDIPTDRMFFSRRLKEMLGYGIDDVGDSIDDWRNRCHPDDLAVADETLRALFEDKLTNFANEQRLRCKDGTYKWALVRGAVVSRDESGSPLRIIGTQRDVSAYKTLQASLEEDHKELLDAQRIGHAGSWKINLLTNQVTWTDQIYRMLRLDPSGPSPTLDQTLAMFTPESRDRLAAAIAQAREAGAPYELDLEMIRADATHGWMQTRGEPLRDSKGHIVALLGVARDITDQVQDRTRIKHLTRLYAALSEFNAAVVRCTTQEELFSQICHIAIERGGMNLSWIGLIDKETGKIRPVEAYSVIDGYMDYVHSIDASIHPDDPRGQGPSGTAARENRPVWLNDFQTDPRTVPWRGLAARYGWNSSASLPLVRGGSVIGILTFYSTEGGWFNDEMRKLLEEMAGSLSFALDKFDAEAEAKSYQETLIEAEHRFNALVEQSIAGSYIFQDGKIVYANPRFADILGYDSAEELIGRSPAEFVHPKDRQASAARVHQMDSGEIIRSEAVFTAIRKDGTTVEVASNNAVSTYKSRPAIIGLLQDTSDRKVAEEQIRRYAQQLEHTFIQTVQLTTKLNEMRDPYTVGHERRVAEISVAIGREMGLDDNTLEGLRVGGYLHDVGKIVVPSEILTKPGKLTANEMALIKEHAQAGYDILKEVDFPWPVAQIALQHHERIDGSGYPNGLSGNQTILEARITAIADVVDAMSTHRPYRASMGLEKALEEIEAGAGQRYDSLAAAACLRLFREKGFKIDN